MKKEKSRGACLAVGIKSLAPLEPCPWVRFLPHGPKVWKKHVPCPVELYRCWVQGRFRKLTAVRSFWEVRWTHNSRLLTSDLIGGRRRTSSSSTAWTTNLASHVRGRDFQRDLTRSRCVAATNLQSAIAERGQSPRTLVEDERRGYQTPCRTSQSRRCNRRVGNSGISIRLGTCKSQGQW